MKDQFFCPALKRRIKSSVCEDRVAAMEDGCSDDCGVRRYFFGGEAVETPGTKAGYRKCNACPETYPDTEEYFSPRKDGKGLKKTCRWCEHKYFKGPAPISARPGEDPPKPAPRKPPPAPDQKLAGEDLLAKEGFAKVVRSTNRSAIPTIRVQKDKYIFFTPPSIRAYGIDQYKTADIWSKKTTTSLVVVFVLKKGEGGSCRLSRDAGQIKIAFAQFVRDNFNGKGSFPLQKKGEDMLFAEVPLKNRTGKEAPGGL